MWHAGAAASEGSWAAPTFRVAAAMMAAEAAAIAESSESAIAEANAEVNAMTAPIFKPFVVVRIPMPSGDYTTGEVMGLNQAGQAVGWMWDDAEGQEHPFFFDPQNGVTMLERPTGTDSGIAYAISDADPPIIVGSLFDTTESIDRAASWEEDGDFINFYYDSETPSAAYGMNASATVIGMYKDPDEPHSFVIEADETEWNPAYTTYSAAQAINASGEVVGWHEVNAVSHAYSWVENTTTDIHPQGWDESGANSINQYGDIAGWVIDDPDGPIPAYWYNTGSFYSFATPFPALGAESMVCGINSHGEMAVTRTDAPGAVIWQVYESADVSFNLSGMALMPDSTGQIASARAINDNLWIGGGYKATSGSDPVPCLIIPYDVDNDGNPDYREIVNEDEADENGNWLIDWAENIEVASVRTGMRSGMHAPGYKLTNKTHDIGYTQIVRLRLDLTDENFATADDETFSIQGILDDGENSQLPDFACNIEKWGRVSGDREIAIWLRSSLNEGDKQHDYLPESPLNVDPVELLASIQEFSYRFARCIDYIQMGNEVWSGAGGYKFYASQLSNCWTSGENPRDFQQMPSGCRSAAATKMFDWLDDQMWAVLEGSALAGRPLRIVGPAVTHSTVSAGFASPTGFAAQSVISTSDWCNERQACFDVHVHYESRQEALDAIDQLMDNDQSGTAPWDVPIYRVALEWGPKVDMDSDWADVNDEEFIEFVTPDCGGEPTFQNWEAFVNDWENDQFTSDPDFGLADTHESFFLYGFTAVCYGPSLGGTDFEYDMAALHADQVCYLLIEDGNKFSELKYGYEDVADGRQIANFEPHPIACSSCGN